MVVYDMDARINLDIIVIIFIWIRGVEVIFGGIDWESASDYKNYFNINCNYVNNKQGKRKE